jgi:predicted nucleic acid-binding protein
MLDQAERKEITGPFAGWSRTDSINLPVSKIKIIKNDPGDDKFIECAAALKADVVITGDKEVLAIKEYMGIRILTPQQFLRDYRGLRRC